MVQRFLLTSHYLLKGKPLGFSRKMKTMEESKVEFGAILRKEKKRLSESIHNIADYTIGERNKDIKDE